MSRRKARQRNQRKGDKQRGDHKWKNKIEEDVVKAVFIK